MPNTVESDIGPSREIQDFEIVLVRAPGEDNLTPPTELATEGCELKITRRNPMSHDEWVLVISAAAPIGLLAAALVQAIGNWCQSRNGRQYGYKRGNEEWKAPSKEELFELIESAGDHVSIRILPGDGK